MAEAGTGSWAGARGGALKTERQSSIQRTDLWTCVTGYRHEDEVYTWEGRGADGTALGIIELTVNIPFIPGNINNASTFDFPVRYESLGEIDPTWVVSSEPHPEVIQLSIAAGKKLQDLGCRAVMGNCGFFGNYQPFVAEALEVPFFGSSLLQVQPMLATMGADQRVGILTADGEALKSAPALEYCGVTDMDRVVIYGMENEPEFSGNLLSTTGTLRPGKIEDELVKRAKEMVAEHPDIGAICLECSELPPHAWAIQQAVRRPMWGFTTMANWIFQGLVRQPYSGWM